MIWIGKGYIEKVYDEVTMIQLSPDKSGPKVSQRKDRLQLIGIV